MAQDFCCFPPIPHGLCSAPERAEGTQPQWCKVAAKSTSSAAKPGHEATAQLLTAAFCLLSFLASGYRFQKG